MTEQLKDRMRGDLNEARRTRDRFRTTVLSTTLSEVRQEANRIVREELEPGQ